MATLKKRSSVKEQTKEDNNNFSKELKESKQIPESPFVAHKYGDIWIITVGRYRTKNTYLSYDECVMAITTPDWEMLTLVMTAVVESINTLKNQ